MQKLKLQSNINIPLVVDLDGTLTLTDTLFESFILFIKKNPFLNIFLTFFWLFQGKAKLKDMISKHVEIRSNLLPYNLAFLEWLNLQHSTGRKLVLCSAANHKIANQVADHFQIFDEVHSSTSTHNLSGQNKTLLLESLYGEYGYIYAGNSFDDLNVWKKAGESVIVNASLKVTNALKKITTSYIEFPRQKLRIRHFIKLLRLHQWAKNILIFLPLLAAHKLYDFENITLLLVAFVAMGLCASSTYMLNDIFDLESDRLHPRKRFRPFASGDIPIEFALLIFFIYPASIFIASFVGKGFVYILLLYTLITLAYSFYLKSIVILDCIVLAALYTIRIIAGAVVIDNDISFWLLSFSVLLFFSLSFLKRYAEILSIKDSGKIDLHGRGYLSSDSPLILSLGTSSGLGSIVVMMLYLNSPEILELYNNTILLWCTIPVLLFWISHIWFQTHRGNMHDDPVIFAVTDKISIASSLIFFTFIFLSAQGL